MSKDDFYLREPHQSDSEKIFRREKRKLKNLAIVMGICAGVFLLLLFLSIGINITFFDSLEIQRSRKEEHAKALQLAEEKIKTLEQDLAHAKLFNYELEHKLMKCMER